MVTKLNSLARWTMLEPGKAIDFGGFAGERRVRLHLNLEEKTVFHLEDFDGSRFLTTMEAGVQTLEFSAFGRFAVFPSDGSGVVMYQTAEGEPTYSRVVDPVIFTKIANRRHRNPELEEIMYRMQQNVERRLAQQTAELESAFARRRKEDDARPAERVETVAPGAAANARGTPVPAPVPVEPEPVQSAKGADGSGEKGPDGSVPA